MNSLQQAQAYIRATLGLSDDVSSWSYDERIAYNKALATYIAQNASSFPAQSVGTANAVLNEHASAIQDTGFLSDLSAFGSAFGDEVVNAGESVAGIGQGFLSFASLTKYLIPLAGIIIVGILLWGFYKKQTA